MRIGIFTGTFDPVHNGHIAFAVQALQTAHLDKIVFMPEAKPWRKLGVSTLDHRTNMLRLATYKHAAFEVLHKPMPQFTIAQTLPWLQQYFNGHDLTLLFGSDVAGHIHTWKNIGKLLERVEFVVGMRQDHDVASIGAHLQRLGARSTLITARHAHTAATHIRNGAQHAVHPDVAAYIIGHQLYRLPAAA